MDAVDNSNLSWNEVTGGEMFGRSMEGCTAGAKQGCWHNIIHCQGSWWNRVGNINAQGIEELLQVTTGESLSNDGLKELVEGVHEDDEICVSQNLKLKRGFHDISWLRAAHIRKCVSSIPNILLKFQVHNLFSSISLRRRNIPWSAQVLLLFQNRRWFFLCSFWNNRCPDSVHWLSGGNEIKLSWRLPVIHTKQNYLGNNMYQEIMYSLLRYLFSIFITFIKDNFLSTMTSILVSQNLKTKNMIKLLIKRYQMA